MTSAHIPGLGSETPLSISTRRSTMPAHDYAALVVRHAVSSSAKLQAKELMFASNTVFRELRCRYIEFVATFCNVHSTPIEIEKLKNNRSNFNFLQSRTAVFPLGGAARSKFVPYTSIEMHLSSLPADTNIDENRFAYVGHVDDIGVRDYPTNKYVHANIPLSELMNLLSNASAKVVAQRHRINMVSRSTAKSLSGEAKFHNCVC